MRRGPILQALIPRMPTATAGGQSVSLPAVIQSGDFKIDLAGQRVSVRDQEVQLTPEEFDLLIFLSGHPQSLVTPRTVLATRSRDPFRRTEFIKTLISLRKKLDEAGRGKHYLRTEPWILYRFDPA